LICFTTPSVAEERKRSYDSVQVSILCKPGADDLGANDSTVLFKHIQAHFCYQQYQRDGWAGAKRGPHGCDTKEEASLMTSACATLSCASGMACISWLVAASQTELKHTGLCDISDRLDKRSASKFSKDNTLHTDGMCTHLRCFCLSRLQGECGTKSR